MNDHHRQLLDLLIRNSGILSRQILKLARWMYRSQGSDAGGCRFAQPGHRRSAGYPNGPVVHTLGAAILFVFTYYIGGSLTRSDQHTLARLKGMPREHAYRLTLFNALFFGIPSAINYFLLGEGFRLLSTVSRIVELPALLTRHFLLSVGLISLVVDLFRMADAAWRRRCWAPFGLMPFIINFPTYLKRVYQWYLRSN